MRKRQRLLWPIHAMILSLMIICVISMGRYIHDYYHATAEAQAVLEHSDVTVEQTLFVGRNAAESRGTGHHGGGWLTREISGN